MPHVLSMQSRIRGRSDYVVSSIELEGSLGLYQASISVILWDIPAAIKFGITEDAARAHGLKETGDNPEIKGYFPKHILGTELGTTLRRAVENLRNKMGEDVEVVMALNDLMQVLSGDDGVVGLG